MKISIEQIIITQIPPGTIFDAHSIIEYLIQNESDIYLSSHENKWTTEYYHSHISRTIDSLPDTLIKQTGVSWSQNIHNNFTTNTCWIKL